MRNTASGKTMDPFTPNPDLDLVLVRESSIPPELVWKAYTTPKFLEQWFCPRPFQAVEWEIELFPGGAFNSVIVSPDGQRFPGEGSILQAEPNKTLVFTNAVTRGFRPAPAPGEDGFAFTAIIRIEPNGTGSTYTATVIHPDAASKNKHEAMGFYDGWNAAFDQLIELMTDHR
jgi:uncharacterized protein YndB with AHSA1/START domain